jgi:hypothetical protein
MEKAIYLEGFGNCSNIASLVDVTLIAAGAPSRKPLTLSEIISSMSSGNVIPKTKRRNPIWKIEAINAQTSSTSITVTGWTSSDGRFE